MKLAKRLLTAAFAAILTIGVSATALAGELVVTDKVIAEDGVQVTTPVITGSAKQDTKLTQLATHQAVATLYQYLPTEGTSVSVRDYLDFTNRSDDPIEEGFGLVRASAHLINDGFKEAQKLHSTKAEPYHLTVGYKTHSKTDKILSIEQTASAYTGGAHTNEAVSTLTVRVKDASSIVLADLFTKGSDWKTRLEYLIGIQQKGSNRILKHIGQATVDYQTVHITGTEQFCLDTSLEHYGLTVFFNPGEIAPISAGVQSFFLPLDTISDIINYDL